MKLKIQEALEKGEKAFRAGRVRDAQIIYRAILSAQPNHAKANHNLGIIPETGKHMEIEIK